MSLSGVEHDGRSLTSSRDPPGQRSVYILPGDTEKESYRMITFNQFPAGRIVDVQDLASAGFYFTGYKDRVKCFSCGQYAEEWLDGDDPKSPIWHKRDCDFVNGRDRRNIPIGLRGWIQSSQNVQQTPAPAAETNSFTSLSATEGVRSRSTFNNTSHNVSTTSGSPARQHPNTKESLHTRSVESSATNEMTFPCLNAVNPHMRDVSSRLQTFRDHIDRWLQFGLRATPLQVAQAGMFYLGDGDRVKCWYCNGGLQNWDQDDDAWFEHAKWFPTCEFLLQKKGPSYVHDIVARFPNIRRPTIRNPASSLQAVFQHPRPTSNSSSTLQIVDPRDELQVINRKVDKDMAESHLVINAVEMGFDRSAIRVALRRNYESGSVPFGSLVELVDFLVLHEASISSEICDVTPNRVPQDTPETVFNQPASLASEAAQEIQRLEDLRRCKKCRTRMAEVLLIPCGHLACCGQCGMDVTVCPACGISVRDKVRAYAS